MSEFEGELKVVSGGRCLSESTCPAVLVGNGDLVYIIGAEVKVNEDGTSQVVVPREIMLKAIEGQAAECTCGASHG